MASELRDLEVFVAVEREGSFGRAANALMITQPAVSERIRHLERFVGRRLFDRSARGATMTAAGTALLPYAQRCIAVAAEAVEAARRADGTRSLVLAVHSTFAPRVVPLVLGALEPKHRRLQIRDVHSEQVAGLIADGIADVGFALHASAPRGLSRVPLFKDRVVCVAAPAHPLTSIKRPPLSRLRDALLAVNAWGDGAEPFIDQIRRAGMEDWRIRYCGDAATAIALAAHHHHVALVARSALATVAADTLREVSLPGLSRWTIPLDLLHRRSDRNDPLLRTLTRTLRSE